MFEVAFVDSNKIGVFYMNKMKILAAMLLLGLSFSVQAEDTMTVIDKGYEYNYTCENSCNLNVTPSGWFVSDKGGGQVTYVVKIRIGHNAY